LVECVDLLAGCLLTFGAVLHRLAEELQARLAHDAVTGKGDLTSHPLCLAAQEGELVRVEQVHQLEGGTVIQGVLCVEVQRQTLLGVTSSTLHVLLHHG
jgi:hypothetical protein